MEFDLRQFWPFGQDALKKYRDWLRKWLLAVGKNVAVVGVCFALLIPLINKQPAMVLAEGEKNMPLCLKCKE
ncbi:MAG: hypothetical protein M0Z31_09000 [Clostridia bacterium]|nr:hypothetical protein [Clostridia bacterium]